MDIIWKTKHYPASALSNFAPHSFVFEGVECASMEGLLQSFKIQKIATQRVVCMLVGSAAKEYGKQYDTEWKYTQRLWWKGIGYPRHSPFYQDLLNRAFDALSTNVNFRIALLLTGGEVLTYSIGSHVERDTVLTEAEFCSRLMMLRSRLSLTGP